MYQWRPKVWGERLWGQGKQRWCQTTAVDAGKHFYNLFICQEKKREKYIFLSWLCVYSWRESMKPWTNLASVPSWEMCSSKWVHTTTFPGKKPSFRCVSRNLLRLVLVFITKIIKIILINWLLLMFFLLKELDEKQSKNIQHKPSRWSVGHNCCCSQCK